MRGNINPNRYTFGALRLVPERNRWVDRPSTAFGPRAAGPALLPALTEGGRKFPDPNGGDHAQRGRRQFRASAEKVCSTHSRTVSCPGTESGR
jgi:hypothetical protein